MPASVTAQGTKQLQGTEPQSKTCKVKDSDYVRREALVCSGLLVFGTISGLSAPGYDLWYLAWFGFVPLFLAALSTRDPAESFVRGLIFGTAYNLVYLSWVLNFSHLLWPAAVQFLSGALNILVWLLFAAQQGVLFGTFCAISSVMPLSTSSPFFQTRNRAAQDHSILYQRMSKGLFPALVFLPTLWVLLFNKLGTATGSMSVPWSMIEYSQYKQLNLLQATSIVGGPGIAALVVLTNLAITFLLIHLFTHRQQLKADFLPNTARVTASISVVILLITGLSYFGASRLEGSNKERTPEVLVSALQGNALYTLNETNPQKYLTDYLGLAKHAPAGICVWPEWSIILQVNKFKPAFAVLSKIAESNKQSWIIGALDNDDKNRLFNAVCTVGQGLRPGEVPVYRKQFLVPFGEYTPAWLKESPLGGAFSTFTPSGQGYSNSDSSGVLDCGSTRITPLLCCELMKPELTTKGVRAGGQMLVDCSNTIWYQSGLLGAQSLAICAFRAAECHRSFVFASSTGPSAIIDPYGRICATAPRNQRAIICDKVRLESDLTPFANWYR